MKISKATIIVGAGIISFAPFMESVVNFLEKNLGKTYFKLMIGIFFVGGVVGFIFYVRGFHLTRIRLLVLLGVLSAGALFIPALTQSNQILKFHVIHVGRRR